MSNIFKFNFKDDNDYEYEEEDDQEIEEEKELKNIQSSDEESSESSKKKQREKIIEKNELNKNVILNSLNKSNENNKYNNNSKNIEYQYFRHSEKNKSVVENKKENEEFNILLKNINDNNKIDNTIVISENELLMNMIKENLINFNISKNKKICYLVIESIKAKNIFNSFNVKENIKSLLIQKITSKKNKNEYSNFRNQINNNNLFILNPNILYKLLSIGFIKISDFGLIIFDDCQLCDGNHQYNLIMQEFYFYYINNKIKMELPNIIGFTTSLHKIISINNNKSEQILKNISENLNCNIIVDPNLFKNNEEMEESNIEYIQVDNYLKEKNKIEGINLILFKFFFEDMLNLCLRDYNKRYGETKELNNENILIIKNNYLNTLKEKFISETFQKYNNIEAGEKSLHFLSQKSIFFKIFEEMQKYLINIIQNIDLEEIYNFFEKYNNFYEEKYEKIMDDKDKYLKKIYKKIIIIFKKCMHAFKRLIDKNVQYNTDRINKFMNKLNDIYKNNENSKLLIFVPNRKIANILYDYLNRNKKDNFFRNKSKFIVGQNPKKEENSSLTLVTRTTVSEINQRIKEYNENKINILICTPSTLEYLDKIVCDSILIFSELSNSNNSFKKVKSKSKICNSKLIIFNNNNLDVIDDKHEKKKEIENFELKNLFLEGDKIQNPKDFKDTDFMLKINNNNILYYYISETEAKISLKNCMILFNEIKNLFISKGIKIGIKKSIERNEEKEQQFICYTNFIFKDENVKFISRVYNDKQSAENECYMKFIIYLHQKRIIDNNFQLLL